MYKVQTQHETTESTNSQKEDSSSVSLNSVSTPLVDALRFYFEHKELSV